MVVGQLLSGLAAAARRGGRRRAAALDEPVVRARARGAARARAARWRTRSPARCCCPARWACSSRSAARTAGTRTTARPASSSPSARWSVAVAACVAVGKRRGLVGESIWLASGAGLLFGLQDAATRAALIEFDRHGLSPLFLHVWVYVVIGSAVVGILLAQSAFKAARLDCSLPPITALEPLVGIALGIGLLGDTRVGVDRRTRRRVVLPAGDGRRSRPDRPLAEPGRSRVDVPVSPSTVFRRVAPSG